MRVHLRTLWHDAKLGLALGLFYGCFVIGVRSFERQLLGLPEYSFGMMVEIVVVWTIVLTCIISLMTSVVRGLTWDPSQSQPTA